MILQVFWYAKREGGNVPGAESCSALGLGIYSFPHCATGQYLEFSFDRAPSQLLLKAKPGLPFPLSAAAAGTSRG